MRLSPRRLVALLSLLAGLAGGGAAEGQGKPAVPDVGPAAPVATPPEIKPDDVKGATEKAAAFLLKTQGEDGGWVVGDKRNLPADSLYIRAAVTAYVVEALKLARPDGYEKAVAKAEKFVTDKSNLDPSAVETKFEGETQRLYAYTLALKNVVRREASEERDRLARTYIREILQRTEATYYGHNVAPATFQLAMSAEALREAQDAGYSVPKQELEKLFQQIESARNPKHGGFGYYAGYSGETETATACRSVSCEKALFSAGRSDAARLGEAVRRMMGARPTVEAVLKTNQDVHDPTRHNVAKYYDLFGLYWASESFPSLPPGESGGYARSIGRHLLDTQRADGSWLDSEMFAGPAYGTATGILTLSNSVRALAAEAEAGTAKR